MVVRAGIAKFCDQRIQLFSIAIALIVARVSILLRITFLFDVRFLDGDPTASPSGLTRASSSGATPPSATSARGASRSACTPRPSSRDPVLHNGLLVMTTQVVPTAK